MKFMSIASGSSGNCLFAGTDNTSILIDAGITRKRINEGLDTIDMKLSDIDAIFVTHEHIDHTKALGVISRSNHIPIYATKDTCDYISHMNSLGDFDLELLHTINPDEDFTIGDITVTPHSVWHDAVDPVCYSIVSGSKKISIATDLGDYDDYIINNLKNSDLLLIEANHDIKMLEVGPYPYDLKMRILSKHGHLSNEAGGSLISSILNDHIRAILLGHLSKENNYPDLAYETVKLAISDNPFSKDARDFNLTVADREICGALYEI